MTKLCIISGGQTGVDRAALDAALSAGLQCGGWCPRNRHAEDGPIDERYPLQETISDRYAARTIANVMEGDGTLVLFHDREGKPSRGTDLTVSEGRKTRRPLLVVDMAVEDEHGSLAERVADWIGQNRISTLNVAGPRESECPGIYAVALALMTETIAGLTRSQS